MRLTACVGLTALVGAIAFMASASGQTDGEAAPIYGVKLPAGYRDWPLISVASVGAPVNDVRAKLGNDVAMKARRHTPVPGWHDHRSAGLEARHVRREQPSYRPGGGEAIGRRGGSEAVVAVVRRWSRNQCAGHGEGREEVRVDRRLGVRAVRRRQAGRRGGAQDLLRMSRAS
jgi:hypothetical protein